MATVAPKSGPAQQHRTVAAPMDSPALQTRLQILLNKSAELSERCEALNHIPGVSKLRKKCQAETQFLLRVQDKEKLARSHLNSTNLCHLQGVLEAAETLPHVVQVLQPFHCSHGNHPIVVDVVCNHGYAWVKVIARKAQALHLVWAGQGQFGERSIYEQAGLYQTCAETYPMSFKTPQLVFLFSNSVTSPMAAALERKRVTVLGKRVPVEKGIIRRLGGCGVEGDAVSDSETDRHPGHSNCDDSTGDESLVDKFNVNVRMSPGKLAVDGDEQEGSEDDCDIPSASEFFSITGDIIHDIQTRDYSPSETEKRTAVSQDSNEETAGEVSEETTEIFPPPLTIDQDALSTLFSKVPQITRVNLDITSLICLASNLCHGNCHYQFGDKILAEQAARERQAPVLPKLSAFLQDKQLYACETAVSEFRTIVGTVGGPQERERAARLLASLTVVPDHLSDRAERLQLTHQIKQRGKTIFGTGDDLQAITVTANSGFVRASMKQGMNFAVFIHEPRALTEQKESKATPL